MTSRVTGTIKFYNSTKGFGFVAPESGGDDVFVHASEINGATLNTGEKVQYELGESRGRTVAKNIKKI